MSTTKSSPSGNCSRATWTKSRDEITGARGREHRGTPLLCQLDRETADTACASLYQHRLARSERAKVDQALASGERNSRDSRRGFE
jgi:hypothetical protein